METQSNLHYQVLLHYFPELNEEQKNQFAALQELYNYWNSKINVISRKDIDLLYERHVLHSLGIAKVISFKPNTKILDVGTGGGFPGIPLAILFPQVNFHLVDSIGKKIKVVEEVTAAIGLKNITSEHTRAEDVTNNYHFVVTRAVTEAAVLYNWVKNKFISNHFNQLPNGILFLKGGDLTAELAELKNNVKVVELNNYFKEEFFETKKVVFLPV